MMVIIDLYLACTALVLMLIEDAPMQNDGSAVDADDPPPLETTAAEHGIPRS